MKTVDVLYLVYVYIPDNLYKKIEGLNYIYNHFEYKVRRDWRYNGKIFKFIV